MSDQRLHRLGFNCYTHTRIKKDGATAARAQKRLIQHMKEYFTSVGVELKANKARSITRYNRRNGWGRNLYYDFYPQDNMCGTQLMWTLRDAITEIRKQHPDENHQKVYNNAVGFYDVSAGETGAPYYPLS